jgi:Predicted transcriptional regulators
MGEIRYIISDASKKIDVEPHVLRYWEEELSLEIPRNEMGHRYYRTQDIDMLKAVKVLKEQGFQLRAIKMLLPDLNKIENLDSQSILKLKEELNEKAGYFEETTNTLEKDRTSLTDIKTRMEQKETKLMEDKNMKAVDTSQDKMGQFQVIMNNIIMNALRENNKELSDTVSGTVSDNVMKEMDYLIRVKEEREEERFKKLDETIRGYQKSRQEIAATEFKVKGSPKKKKGFFKKRKIS